MRKFLAFLPYQCDWGIYIEELFIKNGFVCIEGYGYVELMDWVIEDSVWHRKNWEVWENQKRFVEGDSIEVF